MVDGIKSTTAPPSPLLKILEKGMKAFVSRNPTVVFDGSKEAVNVDFSPKALALLDQAKNTHALAGKLQVMDQVLKGQKSIGTALRQTDIQSVIANFTKKREP